MENIFSPRRVAFIGASNSKAKWGGIVFRNIVKGKFEGGLYPINPKEEIIQGHKVYKDVNDVPHNIDLALFSIPAAAMPGAVSSCVKKGIKAGVVISAGFAELGDAGLDLQKEMVSEANKGGMVLVGPNGQGIVSPSQKFYPWFPSFRPDPGVVGIASQSGNVSTTFAENLGEFGFGCSKIISAGNCADLGWPDYLEYFRQDPQTKVVLLYMEGTSDGREFFDAAKQTALEKPIVLLKSGRTRAGSAAASTHTGVLAGSDSVFDAACRQAGIYRADTLNEASVMAAALVSSPLPKGKRIAMVTGGGGYGVIAADSASKLGLDLVGFSDETINKLKEMLPPWWAPNNPVDMVAGLGYGGPLEIIPVLMESGEVDGVILLGVGWTYQMIDAVNSEIDFKNTESKFIKARLDEDMKYSEKLLEFTSKWEKPLLMTSSVSRLAVRRQYGGLLTFLDNDVMLYPEIEDATRTFAALFERYEFLKKNKNGD